MSTPYGGNDPQQWGQQPQYGQQPGGAYPPSEPQPQQGQGQPPQPTSYEQQPQWGQQPPPYGQQPGYGQPQQPNPYEQPGGAYPPSGPQPQQQYAQPGQYDYGQQPGYPGAPGVEGGNKSKLGLFIGIGVVAVVIAVFAVLGFVAPGFFNTKVFDSAQMQTDVARILTQNYKLEGVGDVSCPTGQAIKDGATFNCTVTVAGKQQQVPITVKGTDGVYQVGAPAAK